MLYVETGREAPYTNAFPGEGKPSPGPPPRSASRKNEPHSYPIPLLGAQRSWEGVWGRACPPPGKHFVLIAFIAFQML